jgi:hypothetical protein
LATATASKRASTKTATKSATKATTTRTVRKSVAKKATASEAPAKRAVAKKTVAKRAAVKQGAAKKASTPRKGPVMLDGQPAHNRHFLLTREIYDRASLRCEEDGISLSDVLRHGIDNYGANAPTAEKAAAGRRLPKSALAEMKRLYRSDSAKLTEYLAACHRAGWPLQALADGLVESGAVDKFSRQAVSLRVLRAPEVLSDSLPNPPALGPRRTITSPRRGLRADEFAKAGASAKREREASTYDFAFRVIDEAYEKAHRRAKYEGAMMSGVLDKVLLNYLDGKYDKALAKVSRNKSA